MDKVAAEKLAEQLISIVDEYEGLGGIEAEMIKADFVKLLLESAQ
jgi:hypothetical protein